MSSSLRSLWLPNLLSFWMLAPSAAPLMLDPSSSSSGRVSITLRWHWTGPQFCTLFDQRIFLLNASMNVTFVEKYCYDCVNEDNYWNLTYIARIYSCCILFINISFLIVDPLSSALFFQSFSKHILCFCFFAIIISWYKRCTI